jgi:predicted nucleotidyltransferase
MYRDGYYAALARPERSVEPVHTAPTMQWRAAVKKDIIVRMKTTRPNPQDLALAEEYSRRLRERIGDNLLSVTLFGSRARGDARDGSDFDLIVKVKRRSSEVREIVAEVDVEMMNEHNELFVGMLYDEDEWAKESRFPLGWYVEEEGIPL